MDSKKVGFALMKKLLRKWIRAVALVLVLAVCGLSVAAKDIVSSGTCGPNLTWEFDTEGTLTISGTGEMTKHPNPTGLGWDVNAVILPDGLTSIAPFAFFEDVR